ncbi:hypothetical protein TIFTF001_004074 [Ficus carica]|uniref:non-specific serine/threonine protein kinase n=1 Tax=Ficus carica TaxID=3494 RepID=A0AA87ZGG7_FICCA|nr:hypothetical protein TIFTF001_004074 [Ficus carica]
MDRKLEVFFLLLFSSTLAIALSNNQDFIGLRSHKWKNTPPNWEQGSDPCGDSWDGIDCVGSRVNSIRLSSMGLKGQMSDDIEQLSELQTLDLSYNKDLTGQLPPSIGNLKNLSYLLGRPWLAAASRGQFPTPLDLYNSWSGFGTGVGVGFRDVSWGWGSRRRFGSEFGTTIRISNKGRVGSGSGHGSGSLNSNHFHGRIPPSIGNLSRVAWLDITDNNIGGAIPVSSGTTPGLDMLLECRHFHLGNNTLTGPIPERLFHSSMKLIHLFFDGNKLSGRIPSSIGLVRSLEVIDISNNGFDESDFPSWFSTLKSLETLVLENIQLQGPIPVELFSLPKLETVKLKNNNLNGTLDIGTSYNSHLRVIELQRNSITDFKNGEEVNDVEITLSENPICEETEAKPSYCDVSVSHISYVTEKNNCSLIPCSSDDQISSPNCKCAYPYTGVLRFQAASFSDLDNTTHYKDLENNLKTFFDLYNFSVDSVSLSNPTESSSGDLEMRLEIFPLDRDCFNQTEISYLGFALGNQTYKPPNYFGPFWFIGDHYESYAGIEVPRKSKGSNVGIMGAAVGVSALVIMLLLLVGVYTFYWKRRAKQGNPSAQWGASESHGKIPQLKGARLFSFKEVQKYTNNFSEANEIGCGGYGKVYLGTLPTRELIAIKRAKRQSIQCGLEFRAEIELLSRVHHKNLVNLIGFCIEQGEQMLIYEYVPNGSLRDSISGKSGVRLDWRKRLKIALDTARGVAYLHELADPPVVHRDIKSNNFLLDNHLNAKVADFGLSKLMGDDQKDHVTTEVKGTLGYIDPEYYTTQRLTEKSDIYSFGVLMLELISARKPIERGKHIVKEVRATIDKTKDLYNLHAILDRAIGFATRLNGFERFVDLAMRCVEDEGVGRPTMSEVMKEIEIIMQHSDLNLETDSTSTSVSYEYQSNDATSFHPYSGESIEERK